MSDTFRNDLPALLRALMLAATLALLATAPAVAADPDLFTVRGVRVDATAETAPAARDRAIAEGRRLAFRRLVERLVPASQSRSIPSPPMRNCSAWFSASRLPTNARRRCAGSPT